MANSPKNGRDLGASGTKHDAPALTLTESPVFRVRLGGARPGRSHVKAFSARIKALVSQQGGAAGRRVRARGGLGGSAAARLPVRHHPQRVIIKARFVKHAKYARTPGGATKAIDEHIAYLRRGGVAEDRGKGVAFDTDGDLDPNDLKAFRQTLIDDRHHFRFIVSPEAGSRLDLPGFARELVREMETDLGTELEWIGVAHYDTDEPHIHLLVRGKTDTGADLVINRDYLSHGMRLQAMEIATLRLGPRLAQEIERSLTRDLKADRVTSLDLQIAAQAEQHPDRLVLSLRKEDGDLAGERERLNTIARLHYLESLGLAREVRAGVWQPDLNLVPQLRALEVRGDLIKRLHAQLTGVDPGVPTLVFGNENPLTGPIVGRVVGVSLDEHTDQRSLVVEALDGKAYYVSLSEHSERPGREADRGSIVRLSITPKSGRRAAGVQIDRDSVRDRGRIIVERLAATTLAAQVSAPGVTWLDTELAAGTDPTTRLRIGATRFEREVSQALSQRTEHLSGLGLTAEQDGKIRPKLGFLDSLYGRELEEAGRRLSIRYGELVRLESKAHFRGRVESIEALPSGPHALVSNGASFTLVPANAALEKSVGRTLTLSLGRGRSLPSRDSPAIELAFRMRFDFNPTHKLRL